MKIQKYFFALILLFCSIYAQTQPTIEKGLLDLTNVSLEDGSQSIKLSGEVEFYWQKLYSPQDFFDGKQATHWTFNKLFFIIIFAEY